MNGHGGIPRSRGAVSGLLLILLGLWGGLAPFVGPYFHFGYTPDRTWAYSSGRLYFSIVPGAAALLGGLIVLGTRNRGAGVTGGLLAALGGTWFLIGSGFTVSVLHRAIAAGQPIPAASGGLSAATRAYLETMALFGGTGVLVLFFGALVIGRFSMLAAKDLPADADGYYGDFPAPPASFPAATGQFGAPTDQYPVLPAAPPAPHPDPATAPFPPQQSATS